MDRQVFKQILYPDIEYIDYHVLRMEQLLVGLGAICAVLILLSGAMPFYRQMQLGHPKARQFAGDVCQMLPNCAKANLVVWNTGNGDLPWQLIVRVHPKDAAAVPHDWQPLQQQVRTYAHTSTFPPIRQQADQLILVIR